MSQIKVWVFPLNEYFLQPKSVVYVNKIKINCLFDDVGFVDGWLNPVRSSSDIEFWQ